MNDLDIIPWGRELIETNDHDPLYVGLYNWDVRGSRLRRFLLAYWQIYSVGAAWYISQQPGSRFWDLMRQAAENVTEAPIGGRWPRAHERRHWRGQKCVDSVDWLRSEFRHPEEAVIWLENGSLALGDIEHKVTQWPQFGPWIAFKAADMLERVLGAKVWFPDEVITLYKDPREGAEMAREALGLETTQEVITALYDAWGTIPAPGVPGRDVNIQEIETCLCKWKAMKKGHYYMGMDTKLHRAELEKWGAKDLLEVYPRPPA